MAIAHQKALPLLLALWLYAPNVVAQPCELQSEDPVALAQRGEALYAEQKFAEALPCFAAAQERDPNATLLYNIARTHQQLRQWRQAVDAFDKHIATKPDNPKAWREKGHSHRELGEDEAAIQAYNAYLELARDAPDRAAIEALIELLQGKLQPATSPQPQPQPELPPPASPPPSPWPWIVAGVGLVGVAAGIGFAVDAKATEEDGIAEPDVLLAGALRDDAERSALIANVSFIVGGVIVVSGVTWGVVDLATLGGGEVALRSDGIWYRAAF